MNYSPDIFLKKTETEKNVILSKYDVMQTIPKNAVIKQDEKQKEKCKEWRWRIFKLPTKENEIIEISYKLPHESRMFMNKNKKWININIDNIFDNYVIEEYYVYELLK